MISKNSAKIKYTVTGIFFPLCVILSLSMNAYAKSKFALIIGNGSYQVGPLKNPTHDAKLMGETLRTLGFELIGGKAQLNLNREQLSTRILQFGDKLRTTKGVGVFYFAGHGVQVKGENYLIPIGAKLEREEHISIYTVPVSHVLQQMEGANNKLNLMILDACRNNPFVSKTRSLTRGIKINSAPSGTLILYATRPGMVSLDGETANSPFTKALTQNMKKQGYKIEDVMRSTIKQVEQETDLRQTPWQEGFVREEFYFVKPDVSGSKCPNGTRFDNGECVIKQVTCPAGAHAKDGRCIAEVTCPSGTFFKKGQGCTSQAVSQLDQSPSNQQAKVNAQLTVKQSVTSKPSSVSFIPTWSYATLALGLVAHATNFLATNPILVNSSFGAAIISYSLAGVGVSYGLYETLTWTQSSTATGYAALPNMSSSTPQVSFSFSF